MAPTKTQLINAYKAARALGITKEELRPVLKDLYNAFDKKWEHIEADNYRALFDAYFEWEDNKQAEDKQRDQRPGKRPHSGEEGERNSSRTESSSELSLRHSSDSGNAPSPRHVATREQTVRLESASASAVPHTKHNNFIKPENEVFTADDTVLGGSNSVRRPGTMNRAARIPRPRANSNGASITHEDKKPVRYVADITKSTEKVTISLVDDVGSEGLPKFNYIPHNIIYENANLSISLCRVADDDCCLECSGDCLSSALPCACAHETGGEFVYTPEGVLKEEFLSKQMSMKREPAQHYVYCQDCPIERSKDQYMPENCKGHVARRFIKECWRKCGCDMQCGNRVVQRGISCKLQVFWTPQGKGWGLRTLQVLEKGSFVCEYVGEILTNTELYERNMKNSHAERHTYPVTLDGDWGSERGLKDEDALCLDATLYGNVARFINHRCSDANLIDIPVQVETPDRHYYHVAFFTNRKVNALEELTWDYGIDFYDNDHPIKAFQCICGSQYCMNIKQKGKKVVNLG